MSKVKEIKVIKDFAKQLLDWREKYGRRGLPWQGQTDPYRVWLSEIMLQQTQVATVIQRYEDFLKKFPTVKDLAMASEEDVMAMWAGMGYYTRARNLWACAKQVLTDYEGSFPKTAQELQTLPGIGPSTAAAIASFCFMERRSIMDGNVKRVLSRLLGIEDPINQSLTEKKLWLLADELLPKDPKSMPHYTQALMDFGATACTPKKVLCQNKNNSKQRACVFEKQCQAFLLEKVETIPVKLPKKTVPQMTSGLLLVFSQKKILLRRRESKGIWGGLWTLPESTWTTLEKLPAKNLKPTNKDLFVGDEKLENYLTPFDSEKKIPGEWLKAYDQSKLLAPIKHVFSHRILYFRPKVMRVAEQIPVPENMAWFTQKDLAKVGLPTPIKKLLDDFFQSEVI